MSEEIREEIESSPEWPKPRELSNEEKQKYHELLVEIAECYWTMHSHAEQMKTDGWEHLPMLLGYERQMFEMMLGWMDEIDAIEVGLICPTNTKPLGEFHARSPDELIEHLTGEKGDARAAVAQRTRNAGVTVSAREGFS